MQAPTPANLPIADRAIKIIADAYAIYGLVTLSCDCGAWETPIDRHAVNNEADVAKTRDMLEHARYDHVSPRSIIAKVTADFFDTKSL
jgi:hypothetical protein